MSPRTERDDPTSCRDPTLLSSGGHARTPTVVVGVDGTCTSWGAFSWACGEAQRLNGRVIAVYVTCTTEHSLSRGAAIAGFDAGAYAAEMDRSHDQQADRLQAEVGERAADLGLEIGFRHLRGDAADRLKAVARETRADVIAVGRSARLRRRLVGSLGRRLTRDRSGPIVVIVP